MLPPFSATSTCPKCLYDRVNVRYSDGFWRKSCVYQCPEQGKGEHIERTCQRCGYSWQEACATDQQQPGDGRGTRNNAVEPSVEETQANHE